MAAEDAVAEVWTFPTDLAAFDDDERISYSKLDGKYIAVQKDGTEYEFDPLLKRWIAFVDPEEAAQMQAAAAAYFGSVGGDDDNNNNNNNGKSGKGTKNDGRGRPRPGDKRRRDGQAAADAGDNSNSNSNKRVKSAAGGAMGPPAAPAQSKAAASASTPRQNTAVYVTGLPPDATVDEVAELFSRKCGVIAEEIDSGRPRIKLYTDAATGRFKGDALVVFFKPQSVDMAIMLLDDTPFRPDSGDDRQRIHVQAADASYKKTNYGADGAPASAEGAPVPSGGAAPGGGGGAGGGGRDRDRAARQDKQKIIKKTQKLAAKLADWSSDEESGPLARRGDGGGGGGGGGGGRSAKWDRTVILRHMFTQAELDEDPAALLDITADIRDECEKLGEVTSVVLFDAEPDGVVSVKFRTAEAAAACVRLMHGRAFDGQIVEARLATGRDKFRKSKKGGSDEDEDEKEDNNDNDDMDKDGPNAK